jgi:hypothetical protein
MHQGIMTRVPDYDVFTILEVGPKSCDFGDDWRELVWKPVEKLNRGGYEVERRVCEPNIWHFYNTWKMATGTSDGWTGERSRRSSVS